VANGGKRDAWTLLTSHGHVLVEIARNPEARIRDLAEAAGITERAAASIVADLDTAGYVTRSRVGRRNRYAVHLDLPFRHPAQRDLRVGPFLELLADLPSETAHSRARRPVPTPSPALPAVTPTIPATPAAAAMPATAATPVAATATVTPITPVAPAPPALSDGSANL